MVLYSYSTLLFYQLDPFEELNNYSKLINNKIIDVLEYGTSKNQYLLVQENGQIDLITQKIEQKVGNHFNVIKLNVENIQLSYLINNEQLVVVSQDGISVYDSNFVYDQPFEFQNNLYAIKKYNDFSKPFVLKNIKNIESRQIITNFTQKLKIKQIFEVNQYLLIVTTNQIQLYQNTTPLQVLDYESQINHCTLLENQYIILSNDQVLQLYQISNEQLQLRDQINQQAIQIKSHYQQNQFSLFNGSGYIQIYKVDQNKLVFRAQSKQLLDLSSYHIDQEYLTICRFDCSLTQSKFEFQEEGTEFPLQQYSLNSIAVIINYDNIRKEYQVICQDGQFYIFDNELKVKIKNNPIGINNIVQEIQIFNNLYLVTILQQGTNKYQVMEGINDYYISVKENDSLFLSNTNELYLLNDQTLAKVTLREQEIGYLEINLFPKRINFIIKGQHTYHLVFYSFERIQDFGQLQKWVLVADVQKENVVLLLNDSSVWIIKAHQNGQIDYKIHYIKEEYKFQQVRLSNDIIILTYQNLVAIYSLNKFELLLQFQAIYPDKNICKEEEITQIVIEQHSESLLVLNLLIQYAGIAIIQLKLFKVNGATQLKLNKKIYSPIDVSEHLRMQMLQTTWQLFNTKINAKFLSMFTISLILVCNLFKRNHKQ